MVQNQLQMQQEWIEAIFDRLALCVNSLHLSDQTGAETLGEILRHTAVLTSDTFTYADIAALDNEIQAWLLAKKSDSNQKMKTS